MSRWSATKLTPEVGTVIHAGSGANDTADAPAITSAAIGSTVHDKASVTGGFTVPTGTVTFTVYAGMECSGEGTVAGTVDLANGAAHPSDDQQVPVGGLSYKAHYNGSDTYVQADGPCEPLNATSLTPVVRTDIHNGSHDVVAVIEAPAKVHDFVAVTGAQGQPKPSGDVTLHWFTNASCAGEPRRRRTT